MVVSNLRRSFCIIVLTLSAVVIAASATPASARPHHGSGHHAHRSHGGHHYARHHHHRRSAARMSRWERGVARMQVSGVADAQASVMMPGTAAEGMSISGGFGGGSVVSAARSFIGGGNPTGRRSLWCARFMNMVLERTGHRGTGSDMARSFASYGQRVSGPQVGAIAVMSRRGGGHVGVVSGVDAQGNPIVISGNNGNRVRETAVSRGRVFAYVLPN
ncbi:TIGR02594 family protein [Bradyrhizobium oligotrophicum]|uniref:TIGR02594 family protein n=1 Tax=Bradyrhizobium oligotrophicum TaxID=44255 RepID=UPI003EB9F836